MSTQPVTVILNLPAAEGLHHLVVDTEGTDLQAGYTRPGQFVKLGVGDDKPGFFAIASAPKGPGHRLEFLIKRQGPTAEALCDLKAGAKVNCSAVMGNGFPMEQAMGRDLLIFVTGSGISAVRAVLESDTLPDGQVHLYYGCLSQEHMAYTERFDDWAARGVTVHIALDHEPEDSAYQGFRGFAQQLYEAQPPEGVDPHQAVAVLCGLPVMLEHVSALLLGQGMPKDRILKNF